MLIGTYHHAIDAKNRIFIPSKWRSSFGDTIFLTQGLFYPDEKCLYGMSVTEWDQFCAKFASLPITGSFSNTVKRRLFSVATECDIDKQGRILVPQNLLSICDIKDNAILVGIGNRFEIWNDTEYVSLSETDKNRYMESMRKLEELGI